MSPVPDVRHVARKLAGNNEDRVDSYLVAVTGIAFREALGRRGDPAQPIAVKRMVGRIRSSPRLHLDERQGASAARDKVDFTAVNARPPRQDAPPAEPEPPGRDGLGAAPGALGSGTIPRQEEARSSARA